MLAITPPQFHLLGRLLDATYVRHTVIAQNMANVNTPGYKRLDVNFEKLTRKLSDPASLDPREFVEEAPGRERTDGNTVDLDLELARLSHNTLLFQAYSQILSTRMAMMRRALTSERS
jgi:flagellar basal-body rod protein FlgB